MSQNVQDNVPALLEALAERVGKDRYDVWFGANSRLVLSDVALTVCVPNTFYQEWLRNNFRGHLEAVCEATLGGVPPIQFEIDPSLANVAKAAQSSKPKMPTSQTEPHAPQANVVAPRLAETSRARRLAELDGYVVGGSNRLAHAAALQAVESSRAHSPLVFHGPPGVGKTHLLEGIQSALRRVNPRANTICLSAEQFTTLFLEALQGSGLPSFRRKYRAVDTLLIDDLHFLVGKRATLVEFMHTADTLARDGRQLVLAADRAPAEMADFGPELVTRLQAGLVCRIDPPESETRAGIARRVAGELGAELSDDVVELIATRMSCTAREIAGAVKRLVATSRALARPITRAFAEETLDDLIRASRRAVRLSDIERAVCQVFGLEDSSLQSSRKTKHVSHPRMLAMWLARKHTRAALSEIGDFFGRRSHSTVISAQNRVENWVRSNALVRVADLDCGAELAIRRVEERLLAC